MVGKEAIGLYLGKAGIASGYGAAGSLVVVLAWVYYAAQILFLGAEFTQVHRRPDRRGPGRRRAGPAAAPSAPRRVRTAGRAHAGPVAIGLHTHRACCIVPCRGLAA